MNNRPSQNLASRQESFIRKALEPITEESRASSFDGKPSSKRFSSIRSSLVPRTSLRTSKVCPTTGGICPTKAAMMSNTETSPSYISDWSSVYDGSRRSYSSLLIKPFIFRRASSLQEAVATNDKKLAELFLNKMTIETAVEETQTRPSTYQKSSTSTLSEQYVDSRSQTDASDTTKSSTSSTKKALNYLIGISPASEDQEEEQQETPEEVERVLIDERDDICGETEAMKQAQRYLRVHRIFEFYQFLVAHLLSALPENPINFLIDLLDKCVIYRASMGSPPLLYDRKHLIALFNLMDRMRTGYIEKEQYAVGMKTLGICSYNTDPPTFEGMIHKDFFVEEAHENLVSMLNDILRRRWIYFSTQPPPMKTPPPTPQFSMRSGKTNASCKR